MAKQAVSSAFAKYEARKAHAHEDAKKAENTMQGIALPIGTEGQAVVREIVADVSKKKADGKGGNPYIRIVLHVVTPEEYKAKKLTKFHAIYNSENATEEDRWTWMLNDLENMGLPREIRENYESFSECIDWFMDEPRYVNYTIVKDDYDRSGKAVQANAVEETSIPEDESPEESPISDGPVNTSDEKEEESQTGKNIVKYVGLDHELLEMDQKAGEAKVRSIKSGRVRTVPISDLEM